MREWLPAKPKKSTRTPNGSFHSENDSNSVPDPALARIKPVSFELGFRLTGELPKVRQSSYHAMKLPTCLSAVGVRLLERLKQRLQFLVNVGGALDGFGNLQSQLLSVPLS